MKCPICGGDGRITVEEYREYTKVELCPVCLGLGKINVKVINERE